MQKYSLTTCIWMSIGDVDSW